MQRLQRNVQKSVMHVQSCFLLTNSIVCFFFFDVPVAVAVVVS